MGNFMAVLRKQIWVCAMVPLLLIPSPAAAERCIRHVDVDSLARHPDGLSWASAFRSVQNGIDSAYHHTTVRGGRCEVWVAEGTYRECNSGRHDALQLRPYVDVVGGFAGYESSRETRDHHWFAHETILDGACPLGTHAAARHVVIGSDHAVLDGFTITGGRATRFGGGMLNVDTSPTVRNCTFTSNRAGRCGGAMLNLRSKVRVYDTAFRYNEAGRNGGAVCNRQGRPLFEGTTMSSNSSGGSGGAMYSRSGMVTVGSSSFFMNNAAADGGGMSSRGSDILVVNSTIVDNTAGGQGGGWYSTLGRPRVINCTLANNTAQRGGGWYNDLGKARVVNSILWDNSPSQIEFYGRQPVVRYSDVSGGYPGVGNFDADPLFSSPSTGDYTVSLQSPCIGSGQATRLVEAAFMKVERPLPVPSKGPPEPGGQGPEIDINIGSQGALPTAAFTLVTGLFPHSVDSYYIYDRLIPSHPEPPTSFELDWWGLSNPSLWVVYRKNGKDERWYFSIFCGNDTFFPEVPVNIERVGGRLNLASGVSVFNNFLQEAEGACVNGVDDDGDGLTDCRDPDCEDYTDHSGELCCNEAKVYNALKMKCQYDTTSVSDHVCEDEADNDGDGLVDCGDPQCSVAQECHDVRWKAIVPTHFDYTGAIECGTDIWGEDTCHFVVDEWWDEWQRLSPPTSSTAPPFVYENDEFGSARLLELEGRFDLLSTSEKFVPKKLSVVGDPFDSFDGSKKWWEDIITSGPGDGWPGEEWRYGIPYPVMGWELNRPLSLISVESTVCNSSKTCVKIFLVYAPAESCGVDPDEMENWPYVVEDGLAFVSVNDIIFNQRR